MSGHAGEASNADLSADLSYFLNVSVDVTTSTPKAVRSRNAKRPAPSPFKRPAVKKAPPKGPVLATCKKCGAEYRTIRYFKIHEQKHLLRELASRVPDVAKIEEKCQEIGASVIEVMASKPRVSKTAGEMEIIFNNIKEHEVSEEWREMMLLLCQPFCKLLSEEVFCMPSNMINTSLKIADDILSSVTTREKLSHYMKRMLKCNSDLCENFLCEFLMTFADQLVVFIFRCLRNASSTDSVNNVNPAVTFDLEERQCIFYIGGSIFHGFKQLARKSPHSKKWQAIAEVIDNRILETDFYENFDEQLKKDRKWTEKRNRGGLKFVTGKTQDFLISVATIIASHEQEVDGSLPVDAILKHVVTGKAKYDWDSIVENAMDQELSFSFMTGVAKSLTSTYGKGIIKRHMNLINQNKPSVSITLRHKVAPT